MTSTDTPWYNRIIQVKEDSTTLGEYAYNGIGQRVSKTVDGKTTYFIYDFKDNLITEADGNGSIVKEYLYRDRIRLAMVDVSSGGIYNFQNDPIGTPVLMTDSSGNVVWEAIYYPFGNASVNPNSEVVNNFRFPGQYFDTESGLHYNYYRYYDPNTGRYLTPDPIGLNGGINLFSYVKNDPINLIDPFGLWSAWGGTTGVASWGPWGGNAGSGIAYDSGAGIGGYTTTGTTTGAGASVGYEAGFYTGSISGKTEIASLGLGPVSIGFVTNDGGSWGWGFVFGFAWGAPAEGTISNNNTIFYPMFDGETNPCP